MMMNIIINSFSLEKFQMRLGKRTFTVKTEVYEDQDSSFKAFSCLSIDRDENFVGYG